MQNTNRRLCLCALLAFSFLSLASAQSDEPQEVAVTTEAASGIDRILPMRTHVVRPILLSFFKSDDEKQIQGEVFFPAIESADRLELEAFDSGGSKIYEQTFDIDTALAKSQKFRIQVPNYGLPAGSRLEAVLYDQESGVGRASKTLPQVDATTKYRVSNLKVIPTDVAFSVQVDFENGGFEPITVRPQVKIWQQSVTPEKIVMREFFDGMTLEAKTRGTLEKMLPLPTRPGVYRVELVALDDNKQVLSGALEDFLVVPGDFADFDGSFVAPVPGAAEGIDLKFVGKYEGEDDMLNLSVAVNLFDQKGRLIDRLTEIMQTPVSRGSFGQKLSLSGSTDELSKVVAEVTLTNQAGEWLSELEHVEDFERTIDPGLEAAAAEAEKKDQSGFAAWTWMHWAGLGLALLILIALVGLLIKGRRKKIVMGFLLGLTFALSGTAHATLEVFWHHPVPDWYYNQDATGIFEDFGVMKVQGNIFNTLTQKGFFYQVPDRIVLSFYKDLTYDVDGVRICTDCFYLEADLSTAVVDAKCVNEDLYVGPQAEICDNKTYRFEIDLPPQIEEGEWGVQLLFKLDGVWYGTNWQDSVSGDWYRIHFDSTPPTLSSDITYDGGTPPLSGQLVYQAKDPLISGPTGLTQLHQDVATNASQLEAARENRDVLIAIADEKLKARNHKIAVEIYDREQAILNSAPNASTLQSQITGIVAEINALTKTAPFNPSNPGPPSAWPNLGINDIAAVLGEFVPPNLAVNPGSVLQGSYGIEPLLIQPAAGDQASNPFNDQITGFQSQITTAGTQIETLKGQLRTIKQIHKPTPVDLGFTCSDPEVETGVSGAGCNNSVLVAPVRGNFCEYDEVCDENAVNTYQVCDRVGNCADSEDIEARLDWYDPVAPDATDFNLIKNKDNVGGTETTITGDGGNDTLAAGDRIAIEIQGSDPIADAVSHPTLFDIDACGYGPTSDFFRAQLSDTFCTQSQVRCPLSSSKRGFQDLKAGGACIGDCPPGYALQGDLCVPFCDFRLFDGCFPFLLIGDQCEVTTWLPEPSTVSFGDSFTQVNNCGQTRQAVGTKSLTGTLRHFLDGMEVFGAYLYDTTQDTLPLTYALQVNLDAGGTDGFVQYTSIQDFADLNIESVNSPSVGRAFKVETFDVAGPTRYGAWERSSVPVSPSTDYVMTYWLKTDATVNKNQEGAWVSLSGNGSNPDIWQQYESVMEGTPGDLQWYKVIVQFTTSADTTQVDVSARVQQQNDKVAYFDDIQIFEENWRFDDSQSWYSETKDDVSDGTCDYIDTVSGNTVDGPDDRCGQSRFPEKAVLVYTTDGFYIFDAEKGNFWMKAVKDPAPNTFGRFVFNELMSGQTFGLNGNLYLAHRFNEPNSSYDDRNGALEVMDVRADAMYTHRMSGCYLLAGYKGTGSSYSSNSNCENNGYYSWSGFVNDDISQRNVYRNPWSNVMPAGRQLATHQINHTSAQAYNSKTYVAVATDYGISVFNKTDNTVKHLEWDGYNGDNYDYDYLHPNGSTYHQAILEPDGSLWYKWNYQRSSDDGSRIWKLNDVSTLTFNNGITSGNATSDSRIQPRGTSGAYPTTAQDEDDTAFDVQSDQVLSGGTIGLEKFYGTMVGGDADQHPNLAKSTITKNYATMPLYGRVLGHWADGVTDRADYTNNLTNQGSVTMSAVDTGTDLQQFNLNGSSQYLSSGSATFNISGAITFGAWVKTTGAENGGYIMSKGSSSVLDFALYRNSDNTLRVIGTDVTDIEGYTLDGWDFVAVTFDGTNKKTYLNGQLISTVADTKTNFNGAGALPNTQYVRVEKTNSWSYPHLYLAEVQVLDGSSSNIATAGTASAHTQYTSANRAIDGNTNGEWYNNSVFRTDYTSYPTTLWWEVDLGSEQAINDIVVWNRTDSRWDYLTGAVVKLLNSSRSVLATSNALSSNTTQNPVFSGGSSSSLFIGTSPSNSTQSSNLLTGAVALPFMSAGAYEDAQLLDMYKKTLPWFEAGAKITIQGTSDNVEDVVFGDDDDYFVVTSEGITHFDVNGVVIRTMTTDADSDFNTAIISEDINDVDYKNRYLILAYKDPDGSGSLKPRGLEILTIGRNPNNVASLQGTSCNAGTIGAYSHGALSHTGLENVAVTQSISFGQVNKVGLIACVDGVARLAHEGITSISCDPTYQAYQGACVQCTSAAFNGAGSAFGGSTPTCFQ